MGKNSNKKISREVQSIILYVSVGIGIIPMLIYVILLLLEKVQKTTSISALMMIFLFLCMLTGVIISLWQEIKRIVLRIKYKVKSHLDLNVIIFWFAMTIIFLLLLWRNYLLQEDFKFVRILIFIYSILFLIYFFGYKPNRVESIKNRVRKIFQIMREQWAICLTITFFIVIVIVWQIDFSTDVSSFFGKENRIEITTAEILKYVGAVCGGILVIGTLYANNKRNYLNGKGQLDIRFKDAALLLQSDDINSKLFGIYAFHQIAIDASKDSQQRGYIQMIKNVLCSIVRESKKVKDSSIILPATYTDKPVQYENSQPVIVLQAIIDVLFKGNESKIYADFDCNLSGSLLNECDLHDVNFSKANLRGVNLSGLRIFYANFSDAILDDADLSRTTMRDVNFTKALLRSANVTQSEFICRVNFSNAILSWANLSNSSINKVSFSTASLRKVILINTKFDEVDFYKCDLKDTDFSNATLNSECNFQATIHESKTIEEIKQYEPNDNLLIRSLYQLF